MLAPYNENNTAVIVAAPSGRLVGIDTLAVMLPTMFEFSVEVVLG